MIKRILATILISGIALSNVSAQYGKNFIGTWEGKLNVGVELTLVFHVSGNGSGGLGSTLDSPDQLAYGIKCDTSFVDGGNLVVEIHSIQSSFTGRLLNDSTIDGKFTQGVEKPLLLHRKLAATVQSAERQIPVNYKNVEVELKQKDFTLSGTCFQPLHDDKSAAVLIIAGSGPTDRNGNSPLLPGENNSLLQLADSLAHYGIASVRYDKRGIGKSKYPPEMGEENVTIDDIASDAKAMFEWLRSNGYKKIFIAGHSEGSLIGLMIAADVKAAGYISISGAGRKAADILKEQVAAQLSSALSSEFNSAIDSLEQGLTVTKVNPALAGLLRPSVQPYIRSWLKQDPQKLIANLRCPVLILQGTNDLQIKEKNAQDLKTAQPKATLVLVKDMNHVMKEVKSSQVSDNMKAYSDPSLPVAHDLVQAVVRFIVRSTAQ